ncbi:PAAR domain-containing protein [Paraburkholderia azotifigens]|uniref:PAAR domain-containing protein n=1 Tax=Paraburkholderia azotifigens TaxID=2057004 RepID=A0A5C6VUI9_9BURK|nr:PAAR domain-containing protein [Paraburkholderia azotifigens]TXC87365.1 PAAR domain-containing protein [Paraburkholderia azotifigens]
MSTPVDPIMARFGDLTDHGGKIVEAAQDLLEDGISVALDGHLVACPRCGGKYPIIASGRRRHNGKRIAYIGDITMCGATLVRSTQQ